MNWLPSLIVMLCAGFLAGCGAKVGTVAAEAEDPEFQRAKSYEQRGDRRAALTSYLSVIAKRGEDFAPESQLAAGLIQMRIGDPFEAWLRMKKYLDQRPNAPQSEFVRAQVDAAKLKVFEKYIGQQSQTADFGALQEEIRNLRKENNELKAMLASTGSPSQMISISQLQGASRGAASGQKVDTIVVPGSAEPTAGGPGSAEATLVPVPAAAIKSAPAVASKTTASTVRTYTVQQSDGLVGIARKVYGGPGTNAQAQAIFEANRDQLPTMTSLKPGMQLKIPASP